MGDADLPLVPGRGHPSAAPSRPYPVGGAAKAADISAETQTN